VTAALGILGGTFDPIHCGHLALAREVMAATGLAAVHLIPAGVPPHRAVPEAPAADRLAMVRLAVSGHPGLVADGREIARPGPSYTLHTLAELRAEDPARPLALIIGADAFLGLPAWHRWRELFDLAHFVVVARPGIAFAGAPPPPLAQVWARRYRDDCGILSAATAGAIVRQPITPRPIAASDVRAALGRGDYDAVRGLLPPAVMAYIERHRLYRSAQDAT
jgi:nicotinate-nucleotide adenylyltransferase